MLLSYYTSNGTGELVKLPSLYEAAPLFYIDMPDGEQAPVFDFKAFPFEIFASAPTYKKRGQTRDQVSYINLACCFDIETTTIEQDKIAFMYQWQYCIEDYVFMGKTWEDFQEFNAKLSLAMNTKIFNDGENITGKSLVCYIFNLQFEFMFMQYFISEPIGALFTDIYEPLIVPTRSGITYRCAYRLTNKSLEQFTKGFPHAKLAGDLDYSVIRVPHADDLKNGLTDLELAYCYNDVKGCCEALRDRLEKDKRYNIASIPLTSTGYVRKDCQRSARKNGKWRQRFLEAQLSPELYQICRAAFRGGNTHSNAKNTAVLMGLPELGGRGGLIKHYDIRSSYPAQMLTRGFPMSPFVKIENGDYIINNLDKFYDKWCFLFTIRLIGVQYRGQSGVPYIAKAKSITRTQDANEIIEDNGRIYAAPYVKLSCTEIDLKIIMRDYQIDNIVVVSCYRAVKRLLPYEIRRVILDYYRIKCELSASKDPVSKYNRARAKEDLNACYGMMCMRIDRLEYAYNNGQYSLIEHPLSEMINKFYSSESSFLWYQWALWTTAHARAALDAGCQIVKGDLIYTDTDSVFYVGDHEAEFEQLNSELIELANKHGATAQDKNGKDYPIGIWEREPDSKLFKTLGAKKYLLSEDGQTIQATISGVSKSIGQKFFTEHGFDAFNDETVIPVSGKVSAHYNNDKPHYIEVNGVKILTASNVALINASYTISLKPDYKHFIKSMIAGLEKRPFVE